MGFTCYSVSFFPALRDLADHLSLALTWNFILYLFRMRNPRVTISQIASLTQSSFKALFLCYVGRTQIKHCLLPSFLTRASMDANGMVKMRRKNTLCCCSTGGKRWCDVLCYHPQDKQRNFRDISVPSFFSFAATFLLCFVSFFVSHF